MRLFRYATPTTGRQSGDGAPGIAVARNGDLIDLAVAWRAHTGENAPWGSSTLSLIQAGPEAWAEVASAVSEAPNDAVVADGYELRCPLDAAASLRDFLAFESHVKAGAARRKSDVPEYWYEAPIYYKGNHRSLIGPEEVCPWPSYTSRMDFELELAMVVGRNGRDIAAERAEPYIFGFSVMNDFSARDVQAREMSAWLGPAKGKDFATALGPCIVTTDELGAEPDLEMIARVNGEEWGRARSSDARWSWAEMLEYVSRDEDVWAGDVYGSGTPGGCCGLDLGRDLQGGDVVELEIQGIGILRNVIAQRSAG